MAGIPIAERVLSFLKPSPSHLNQIVLAGARGKLSVLEDMDKQFTEKNGRANLSEIRKTATVDVHTFTRAVVADKYTRNSQILFIDRALA